MLSNAARLGRCYRRVIAVPLTIDLSGRKSWCVSNDPEFAAKAAEIVGLYMAPPDNAVVLAVDEKPSIQALERAQGYLEAAQRARDDRSVA